MSDAAGDALSDRSRADEWAALALEWCPAGGLLWGDDFPTYPADVQPSQRLTLFSYASGIRLRDNDLGTPCNSARDST